MPSCSDCLEKSDDSMAVKRRDQQIEVPPNRGASPGVAWCHTEV